MNRTSWKCLLIGAVVAVTLLSSAPQANAHWWGWYQPAAWSCGYGCGYGPCYSPCYAAASYYSPCCYDSCGWSAAWRPGPVRRLLFGRYKWYWSGCGWSCCETSEVCCDQTAAPAAGPTPAPVPTPAKKPVEPAAPAMPPEPAAPLTPAPATPAPAAPGALPGPAPGAQPPEPAMPKTSETSLQDSGVLTIWVPYDAKVTVNGLQTRSTGSRRQFVSYGLKPGFSYKYVVKAEVVRDGQVQEDTRTVVLTAGQITAVAFGFNVTAQVAAAQ